MAEVQIDGSISHTFSTFSCETKFMFYGLCLQLILMIIPWTRYSSELHIGYVPILQSFSDRCSKNKSILCQIAEVHWPNFW